MLTVLHCLLAAAALPLLAFLILLLWGHRLGRRGSGAPALALTFALASLALSVVALILWVASDRFKQSSYVEAITYHWISLPSTPVATPAPNPLAIPANSLSPSPPAPTDGLPVGILIDSLTIATFLCFTVLNVLILIFALGHRENEPDQRTAKPTLLAWLAFLNFAVLNLALSNSILQLFVLWELISLSLFFIIRPAVLDYTKERAPALRMYVMQAIGSTAFILAIGILAAHTNSLSGLAFFDTQGNSILSQSIRQTLGVQSSEFLYLPGSQGFMGMHWLTWAGICFLVAALARMAQFPFHTWLANLTASPAVASAITAAATMVSGAILLARVYPILTLDTRFILTIIGCVTLALGALIALVQTDIRRILLWSTVSQGGYVIMFLGAGGYAAGILHLFTHAFVKTALILAAGSVVASTGTADLRQMGGLWKRLPLTAIASLLAVAAVSGVPWLSGAYSTNLGLDCVYDYAHTLQDATGRHFEVLLFHVPAIFTYITALGMGRWWWLIFGGTSRDPKILETSHESAFLTLPIIMLAGSCACVLYDFESILLALITKSIPATLFPHGAPALVVSGSELASQHVLLDTGWAFTGIIVAVLLHYNGFSLSRKFRRLPGVNMVDYWLRCEMFFDPLYEGVLVPAARGVAGIAVMLERAGRELAHTLSNIGPLGNALAARIERSKMAPTANPPASQSKQNSQEPH